MAARKVSAVKDLIVAKQTKVERMKEEINECSCVSDYNCMISFIDDMTEEMNKLLERAVNLEIEDNRPILITIVEVETALRRMKRDVLRKIFALQSNSDRKLNESNNASQNILNNSHLNPPLRKSKLPVINLPIFKGDPNQYLNFWESFKSHIHLRNDLDDLDKFQYFQSLLRDEPYQFVSSYAMSAGNYLTMLDAFEKKYRKADDIPNFTKVLSPWDRINEKVDSDIDSQSQKYAIPADVSQLDNIVLLDESTKDSQINQAHFDENKYIDFEKEDVSKITYCIFNSLENSKNCIFYNNFHKSLKCFQSLRYSVKDRIIPDSLVFKNKKFRLDQSSIDYKMIKHFKNELNFVRDCIRVVPIGLPWDPGKIKN